MANWSCGTLRIRGEERNVMRFLCEGFENIDNGTHPIYRQGYLYNEHYSDIYRLLDMEDDVVYAHNIFKPYQADYERYVYATAEVEVKGGGFRDVQHLVDVARKYSVDFRLRMVESGNAIDHSIEIINGRLTMNCERTYENFIWECDIPTMGD